MRKLFIQSTMIALVCAFALPSLSNAFELPAFPPFPLSRNADIHERIANRISATKERLCARIPSYCQETPPPPVDVCPNVPGNQASGPCADTECTANGGTWDGESCDMPPSPPIDVCPNVPGDQASGPCADVECVEDGGTWNGTSCDMPPPPEEPTLQFSADPEAITEGQSSTLNWNSEHAETCTASNGWSGGKSLDGQDVVSPNATITYKLECTGDGGTISKEVTVTVTPVPPVIIGHMVVSEVHYDVDATHGNVNTGNDNNEWVELYNGSAETVNLSGWKLADNTSNDLLPEDTTLPAGAFLIVTATSTTEGFWNIPAGVQVIVLGTQIGNGLAVGGDVVTLLNAGDTVIDAVSWGSNTSAFNPSVTGVVKGHSIERAALMTDTDTANDWEDHATPSPGMESVPSPSGTF